MAKEIDRQRAQGALAVLKQHPAWCCSRARPRWWRSAVVWWLFGAGWAALLLVGIALGLGGAAALVMKRH